MVPAERGVGLGAAVQFGTVHLGRGGSLYVSLGRGVGAAKKALPQRVLREGLGATLLDQTLHNLMLCSHGTQDPPTGHLTVGILCPVTAVQT